MLKTNGKAAWTLRAERHPDRAAFQKVAGSNPIDHSDRATRHLGVRLHPPMSAER